jgi:tetratricopeptide (TPR) repeat protein
MWLIHPQPTTPPPSSSSTIPTISELTSLDPIVKDLLLKATEDLGHRQSDSSAWGRLGMLFLAYELPARALPCFIQAESLDPTNPRWPYFLGRLWLTDPGAPALIKLRRAVDLCRDQPDYPRLFLAQRLMERGELEEAEEHLIHLQKTFSGHAPARLELARLESARGHAQSASALVSPCLTNQFTARSAYLLLASVEQKSAHPARARQARRIADSLPPDLPWPDPFDMEIQSLKTGRRVWVELSQRLLAQNQLEKARPIIEKLTENYPKSPEGWLYLGRFHLVQRQFAEAARALEFHLELEPESFDGWMQHGLLQLEQKRDEEAADDLARALAIKPDAENAHYYQGLAQQRLHQSNLARDAYRNALRCRPGFIKAYVALARLHLDQNQPDEARELLNQALAINPFDLRLQEMVENLQR